MTVDELVRGVEIALGLLPLDECPSFDADMSRTVTVDELVTAVNNALNGCAEHASARLESARRFH
ncbi:MAG: hypothetical protein HYR72_11070 [Deltaproteobacteria bacterium]|nr:hypothetical protein [Deltaproteobacteria bacterium]MBI3388246.1 hypothetical protein [Deltaproteobacteria bacterium]